MSIAHHPEDAMLMAYASGAADEATSLVIATHLALCTQCRRAVAVAESAGGALLDGVTPEAVASHSLDRLMARLDTQDTQSPRAPSNARTPEPLRSYLGSDIADVKWRKIAPGIAEHRVIKRGKSVARLLKATPGTAVSQHTHHGEELTLILTGGLTDHTGQYHRGDVQSAASDLMHEPTALPGEDCIVLAVTDAPLKFTSLPIALFAKLLRF